MTVENLLSRLNGIRRTARGWTACCPAHADKNPSLSACAGDWGILLKCWAGCSLEEICTALGIAKSDLFYQSRQSFPKYSKQQVPKWRSDWRHFSHAMLFVAEGLYLRAQRVLQAAKGLSINTWTDNELTLAFDAVCLAMENLRQSERLEDFVVCFRHNKLQEEAKLL